MAHSLDKTLFDEVTGQLKAKAIRVKTGTLVDATIIASASEDDDEGHWVKHVHGFKAHVGADADTALVEEIAVTPANVNDGKAGPDALPDNPGEVFADSAYRGHHSAMRCVPRVEPHASSPPVCGDATRPKHWPALRPSTNRSTAFVAGEDLRHLETKLRPSPDAMAGACQGGRPNLPHCHRLQYETQFEGHRYGWIGGKHQ